MQIYTIPASSSPWNNSIGSAAARIHYAGSETYGAYYTWCAATAGTCVNSSNASGSICPSGWKLPTKGQYDTLASKKTGSWNSGWTLAGSFFPAAGYVGSGRLNYVGSQGWYWSSTSWGTDRAYRLSFGSDVVYTTFSERYYGMSIRCIAP